jgi:hypothetical protein
MIHLAPRATHLALAGMLLAATAASARHASAQAGGPAVGEAPAVPGIEGLPAFENGSPYADVMQSPTAPEAQAAGPAEGDAGYAYGDHAEGYAPRLPGRVRSYIDNRPQQQPLRTESWLNRPFSASFFLGGVFLGDPIRGLEGDAGIFYGGRFGWDFAPRFGMEGRIGGGSPGVSSTIFNYDLPQTNLFFTDVNWLWYPTGDTRWRPYFSAGTGLFNIDLVDASNHRFHESLFEIPFGVGFKYRYSTRTVMRFEVMDNFAFGTGLLDDMHNISITAGLETRFGGGNRKSYYPWKPDRDWR